MPTRGQLSLALLDKNKLPTAKEKSGRTPTRKKSSCFLIQGHAGNNAGGGTRKETKVMICLVVLMQPEEQTKTRGIQRPLNLRTPMECPFSFRKQFPVSTSHTRTSASPPAVTTVRPVARKQKEYAYTRTLGEKFLHLDWSIGHSQHTNCALVESCKRKDRLHSKD